MNGNVVTMSHRPPFTTPSRREPAVVTMTAATTLNANAPRRHTPHTIEPQRLKQRARHANELRPRHVEHAPKVPLPGEFQPHVAGECRPETLAEHDVGREQRKVEGLHQKATAAGHTANPIN